MHVCVVGVYYVLAYGHDKNYVLAKKLNMNRSIKAMCMHIDMIKTVCKKANMNTSMNINIDININLSLNKLCRPMCVNWIYIYVQLTIKKIKSIYIYTV